MSVEGHVWTLIYSINREKVHSYHEHFEVSSLFLSNVYSLALQTSVSNLP